MSPEQALGQPIDARADLYAVGILLYLLSTGRRPFDGPTDMEVLVRVQSGQYTPAEERQSGLSQSLLYVIRKAMHQDRDQRYQSADELLVDLEAILRSEFGSAGQTALKLWLAQLSRRDGELPISRNNTTRFSRPGSESVEGKSVELGDDEEAEGEIELGQLEATGGRLTDPTVRNVVVRRGTPSPPRITGSEATSLSDLAMPLPDDGPRNQRTSRAQLSHSSSDMALSVHEEEPPVRMGRSRSRGRGFVRAVVMLAALGGAGAVIWKVLNRAPADAAVEPEAPAATPTPAGTAPPPAPTPPATATPTPAPAATPPAAEEKKTAEEKKPALEKPRPAEKRPAADKPVHERAHAPDPYARARSWQKPEEPIAPGIEHTKPPAEEQPAPTP
jgi:hypothetical protein